MKVVRIKQNEMQQRERARREGELPPSSSEQFISISSGDRISIQIKGPTTDIVVHDVENLIVKVSAISADK